jgi:hypothetical protein
MIKQKMHRTAKKKQKNKKTKTKQKKMNGTAIKPNN